MAGLFGTGILQGTTLPPNIALAFPVEIAISIGVLGVLTAIGLRYNNPDSYNERRNVFNIPEEKSLKQSIGLFGGSLAILGLAYLFGPLDLDTHDGGEGAMAALGLFLIFDFLAAGWFDRDSALVGAAYGYANALKGLGGSGGPGGGPASPSGAGGFKETEKELGALDQAGRSIIEEMEELEQSDKLTKDEKTVVEDSRRRLAGAVEDIEQDSEILKNFESEVIQAEESVGTSVQKLKENGHDEEEIQTAIGDLMEAKEDVEAVVSEFRTLESDAGSGTDKSEEFAKVLTGLINLDNGLNSVIKLEKEYFQREEGKIEELAKFNKYWKPNKEIIESVEGLIEKEGGLDAETVSAIRQAIVEDPRDKATIYKQLGQLKKIAEDVEGDLKDNEALEKMERIREIDQAIERIIEDDSN
jgi:hypothetical protein